MKGLERIPQFVELEAAYALIQSSARRQTVLTPVNLALFSQWTRFDPRLGEQLVGHLGLFWRKIGPLELHEELRRQPWAHAMGVILLETANGMAKRERPLFKRWMALVMQGLLPANNEQFFIGLRPPGSRLMLEDVELSHRSYRRWGYYGRESLFNKAAALAPNSSRLDAKTRRRLLDELLRTRERITVHDYQEAMEGGVSLRVAELDLKRHPSLRARGNTRGRFYRVVGTNRNGALAKRIKKTR